MQFVKPDHVLQCVVCNQIFLTQQALFSHLDSFHANQMVAASSLPMRQSSMPFSHTNPNSNSNYYPTAAFRNHDHNQMSRFQNTIYPVTAGVETPNFQLMPMTNNNNINFIIGQPQFEFQPPQPQPHLQPPQPRSQLQPPQPQPLLQPSQSRPQLQPPQPQPHLQPPQPRSQLQPPQPRPLLQPSQPRLQIQLPQPRPQLQPSQPRPQLQVQTVDVEMSLEDEIRTLPLIQQLERKWQKITLMEDNKEDSMDLKLKF